ncbi:FAD-dependent oxidoreductase [Nocardia nova]|uniref:Amine oxidase domain-containing protein n=1 Tax=Nocardia nova TaxID=37330 RepID=A0A2S5ZZZ7_9NOCA|nr:FAD-dependent oxidoreductase [Nocardia nova]PPJ24280.1 hypothetical protein C5F51_26215 [Nocardia nova]
MLNISSTERERAARRGGPGRLCTCPGEAFVAAALESLRSHYPEARTAKVLRTRVIHQSQATFSAHPGFESLRLDQTTPVRGLFRAGDWTRTELRSTMESAAEGARRAVDAVRDFTRSCRPAPGSCG